MPFMFPAIQTYHLLYHILLFLNMYYIHLHFDVLYIIYVVF